MAHPALMVAPVETILKAVLGLLNGSLAKYGIIVQAHDQEENCFSSSS